MKFTKSLILGVFALSMLAGCGGNKKPVDPTEGGSTTPTPVETQYFVVGSFNEWTASEQYLMTAVEGEENHYVYSNLELEAGAELKCVDSKNNWYPSGMGNNTVAEEAGVYNVHLRTQAVDAEKTTLEKVEQGAEFPSAEIAELLKDQELQDSVPAYTGAAISYEVVGAGAALQIAMEVGAGNEAAAITGYGADLLAAGYTEAGEDTWGDMHYKSAHEELDICPWDGNTAATPAVGFVYIDIEVLDPKAVATWPTDEQLLAYLSAMLETEITDTIPAYEGAMVAVTFGTSAAQIGVQLPSDVEDTAAVEAYAATLLAAGYTEAGVDSYGDMHYTSPNSQLDLGPWAGSTYGYDGYIIIDIAAYTEFVPAEMPAEVAEDLAELGITDVIPEPEFEVEAYTWYNDDYGMSLYIKPHGIALDAAIESYEATLLKAGYTLTGDDGWGNNVYTSPNNQIEICPWGYSTLILDVYLVEPEPTGTATEESYTLEGVVADVNALLQAQLPTAALDEDGSIFLNMGAKDTDDEATLKSAVTVGEVYFLPDYMEESIEFYDDPASEDFIDIFDLGIAAYYAEFVTPDESIYMTFVSCVYNGNLMLGISVGEN